MAATVCAPKKEFKDTWAAKCAKVALALTMPRRAKSALPASGPNDEVVNQSSSQVIQVKSFKSSQPHGRTFQNLPVGS